MRNVKGALRHVERRKTAGIAKLSAVHGRSGQKNVKLQKQMEKTTYSQYNIRENPKEEDRVYHTWKS